MAKQEVLRDEELAQISAGAGRGVKPPPKQPPVGPGPVPGSPECDTIDCEDQTIEHMSQSENEG